MNAFSNLKDIFKPRPEKQFESQSRQPDDTKVTLILIPGATGGSRRLTVSRSTIYFSFLFGTAILGTLTAFSVRYFQIRGIAGEMHKLQMEHESIRSEASALYTQLRDVQTNLNQVDHFSNQVREATKLDDSETQKSQRLILNDETKNKRKSSKSSRPSGANEPSNSVQNISGSVNLMNKLSNLSKLPSTLGHDFSLNIPSLDGIGPVSKEEYQNHLLVSKIPQNLLVAAKVKTDSLEFESIFNELNSVKDQSIEQIDDLSNLLTEVHQYRTRLDQTPTISPVNGRLTSHFGYRESPINGQVRMHRGLDIAAPLGSAVRAAAAGVVLKTGRASDYGKYVELSHGHEIVTVYAHAQQILVKAGEQVVKGQKIALVGMTGRTTGPHLHYEVRIGKHRVNPFSYISLNSAK